MRNSQTPRTPSRPKQAREEGDGEVTEMRHRITGTDMVVPLTEKA